jgi:hypothetical protein
LTKKLESDVKRSITGRINKNKASLLKSSRNIDFKRTIKKNLKNYDFNEKYTKPKDSTNMLYELECSELKYGLVPYYDETFYSHGGNTYSTLNSYRIGVMNRLFDYNENDININYNEKFKSPIESCSMKLFSLDKNGNENIIQQITF